MNKKKIEVKWLNADVEGERVSIIRNNLEFKFLKFRSPQKSHSMMMKFSHAYRIFPGIIPILYNNIN